MSDMTDDIFMYADLAEDYYYRTFEEEVAPFDCDIELQRLQDSYNGVRCIHCGIAGLQWGKTQKGNWRLYRGSEVHFCKQYKENRG